MNLGAIIKNERLRQGHPMAEIARRSGITNNSIASVEDGTATIMTMEKVINSLGCRLTWEGYPKGDTLGSAMRQVRQRKGLSQADLGQAISVTPRTLITLENHTKGRMRVVNAVLKELRIKPKVIPKNRRLVPTKNGPELDVVYTPRMLAHSVVGHFKPTGTILEPCRGSGHFYDAFPSNATKHHCEIDEGLDFFDWHEPVDWIISNPPWSQFRAFNVHAMGLAKNIVWIIPLVHFSGKARVRDVREFGFGFRQIVLLDTPRDWPQGGYQLAAFHLKHGYAGPTCTLDFQIKSNHQKRFDTPTDKAVAKREVAP